ncbi:carboxypeptidase regulatory-like domain-containing protein [Cohnella cellulosilytica]|uniref:Carboxypeptidase regulatory-like domain-containing protein n=1 Tax=Cohnella cellulosilytica TaxID=986710 RepID=A0ABW2FCD7_9BACL
MPGAPVTATDANSVVIGSGVSDEQGSYILPDLSEGETTVTVIVPTNRARSETTMLEPNHPDTIQVRLPAGPLSVVGAIVEGGTGAPVPGAIVTLIDASNVPVATVVADGAGVFRFDGLAPGSYTIAVSAPLYGSVSKPVAVSAEPPVTDAGKLVVTAGFGALAGSIRDESGRPIAKALAELFTAPAAAAGKARPSAAVAARAPRTATALARPPQSSILRSVISDEFGRYSLTNLPPGALPAYFSFPGKRSELRAPVIVDGRTTVLDIVLLDEEEE